MARFIVEIKETYVKEIEINADSEKKALILAEKMANNDAIMLNDEYYSSRHTKIIKEGK